MSKVFVSKTNEDTLEHDVEKLFFKATNNLAWLKSGDRILLKPALNSPDVYPATTHPVSIRVIARILRDRGAKVIVGDQSGIEHVVHDETGVVRGSSRENYKKSGMEVADTEFRAFEEGDFEKDFFHFKSKNVSSWKNGFYLCDIINQVDHIINLPRLSTHLMGGVTLGYKNAVGLLREDSRIEFHHDGPYSKGVDMMARGTKLKTDYKNENRFVEKIVEVNLAIKEKLRLTFFVGTKAQTLFGPDRKMIGFLKAHVVLSKVPLLIASDDSLGAEAVSFSFLKYLYDHETPKWKKIVEDILLFSSRKNRVKRFRVWDSPFIKHATEIGLGEKGVNVDWDDVDVNLRESLTNYF